MADYCLETRDVLGFIHTSGNCNALENSVLTFDRYSRAAFPSGTSQGRQTTFPLVPGIVRHRVASDQAFRESDRV